LEYEKYKINFVTGDKELLLSAPRKGLQITNLNYCRCPICGNDTIQLFLDRKSNKRIGRKCTSCNRKECNPCDVSVCEKYKSRV
jgi:hypothetical protein